MKQKEEKTKDKKCCRERRGLKEYKKTKIKNKEERLKQKLNEKEKTFRAKLKLK